MSACEKEGRGDHTVGLLDRTFVPVGKSGLDDVLDLGLVFIIQKYLVERGSDKLDVECKIPPEKGFSHDGLGVGCIALEIIGYI